MAAVVAVGLALLPCNAHAHQASAHFNCAAPASVLRSWVGAWKAKDFRRMVALSQVSWRKHQSQPVETLSSFYGFKDVLNYRYLRCEASNIFGPNVFARVTFRLRYRALGRVKSVLITANVIREDRRGYPSATGQWGVNPLSALRQS